MNSILESQYLASRLAKVCLHGFQIDVAEIVDPEVVNGRGQLPEIVGSEASVALCHTVRESGQQPSVGQVQRQLIRLKLMKILKFFVVVEFL